MNWDICKKTILKTVGIAIFAVLFYTSCEDNSVNVVTPEVTTFVDARDGKTYKKVQIGEQIWMAENLRYEADGSKCFGEGGDGTMVIDETYHDQGTNFHNVKTVTLSEHCDIYGRLYDWNTAMNGEHSSHANPSGVEGVCPVGWHLPSDAEWQTLIDYVEPHAGTKLKARSWYDRRWIQSGHPPVPTGTDKYRFTALPSGYVRYGAANNGKSPNGYSGYWWSSTEMESHSDGAWIRDIQDDYTFVGKYHFEKHHFLSVRCVHD